jgi:aminoglycoside 3-N-acetyltransferase
MKDINLFQNQDGTWITTSRILGLLEKVKAPEARILYIHSGITFGLPDPTLSRRELLGHLYEIIASLGIPTICVPTFTFSFCNGADYCVETSPSKMGALNEFIRKLPDAVRSVDPLMSTVLIGEDRDLVTGLGKNSIGENSTFDKLHRRGADAKFLFLGTTVSECFTYTHYVEERLGSPYRYHREFSGLITQNGRSWEDTYTLFVRYKGVVPSSDGMLEEDLIHRGLLRKEICGQSSIACVSEPDGYETIVEHLERNGSCYIAEDPGDRNKEFTVNQMVSL